MDAGVSLRQYVLVLVQENLICARLIIQLCYPLQVKMCSVASKSASESSSHPDFPFETILPASGGKTRAGSILLQQIGSHHINIDRFILLVVVGVAVGSTTL